MLRVAVVFSLALVSACAGAPLAARESARAVAPNDDARAVSVDARSEEPLHGSKLAPPFGRSAGVRRVAPSHEPSAPEVLAAAEQN